MQDVGANQASNKLKYGGEDIGPGAHDVGDNVANGIADIFTAAIASKDSAEKVTNAAYQTANRVADGMNDGVAKIFQDLGDDIHQFLDQTADLNKDKLNDRDYDLDQLDDGLKD